MGGGKLLKLDDIDRNAIDYEEPSTPNVSNPK